MLRHLCWQISIRYILIYHILIFTQSEREMTQIEINFQIEMYNVSQYSCLAVWSLDGAATQTRLWCEDGHACLREMTMSTGTYPWGTSAQTPDNATSIYDNVTCCGDDGGDEGLSMWFRIIMSLVLLIALFVAIAGNSVVCVIVWRKPAMRSAINLMLASLAVSDILMGLLCMPLALTTLIMQDWPLGSTLCRLVAWLYATLACHAICVLLVISLDRYLIIVCRKDKMTPGWTKLLLLIVWIYSALVALPPLLGWSLYTYYNGWVQCALEEYQTHADLAYISMFYSLVFYLPMVIIGLAFLVIILNVRGRSARVHMQPEMVTVAQGGRIGLSLTRPPYVNISFKRRSFKTLFLLFVVCFVCYTPYAVCLVVWNVDGRMAERQAVGTLVLCLTYLSCALHPVIYCWRIRKFREACRELAPKTLPGLPSRRRRRVNPSEMYECTTGPSTISTVVNSTAIIHGDLGSVSVVQDSIQQTILWLCHRKA